MGLWIPMFFYLIFEVTFSARTSMASSYCYICAWDNLNRRLSFALVQHNRPLLMLIFGCRHMRAMRLWSPLHGRKKTRGSIKNPKKAAQRSLMQNIYILKSSDKNRNIIIIFFLFFRVFVPLVFIAAIIVHMFVHTIYITTQFHSHGAARIENNFSFYFCFSFFCNAHGRVCV